MDEIEIIIVDDLVIFDWNDREDIQPMAEELGVPDFPEPRPCG